MERVSSSLIFLFLIGTNYAVPLINSVYPVTDILDNSDRTQPLLWSHGEKSYYVGVIFKANFFEAQLFCSLHRMRLLSILSNDENVFLGEKLYDNDFLGTTDSFWTSGTKLPDDEHWVWMTTGSRISFTNWAPLPPSGSKSGNGTRNEKCLEVNKYKIPRKRDLFWTDQGCATKNYFICEFITSENKVLTIRNSTEL